MTELVSVVVPVFNGIPHLSDLTDSILRQTHANLDIVFVDGGSADESVAFLQSIADPRIRVLLNPDGTGAAQNWNVASEAAHGAYVKLVCQDDILHAEAISKQLADLQGNPTAVMAIAQRDIIDAHGGMVYRGRGCAGLPSGVIDGNRALRAAYLRGTNVFGEPVTVLFRREHLMQALAWDDTDPFTLDLKLYAKVARTGDVVIRKESIGAFRVSASSWSTRLVGEQIRQFRRWQHSFASSLPSPPSVFDRCQALIGLHIQAFLRRGAYRLLRIKGSFDHPVV